MNKKNAYIPKYNIYTFFTKRVIILIYSNISFRESLRFTRIHQLICT